jgi:Fanconi anemia group M protein
MSVVIISSILTVNSDWLFIAFLISQAVQQVLNNLLISQIEIRTEESNDIKKYSHERKVDKVVVPLGDELTKVKTKYIQVIEVI